MNMTGMMKLMWVLAAVLGLMTTNIHAQDLQQPRIEVCFVLDTTGSMSGLIEGAKQKIWSMAGDMLRAKPTPAVKIALLGYRDRGDQYVTQWFDLTDDIDAMYAQLMEFKADGGGDGPESVNQALHEAVTKISWSKDKSVYKVIFLVGDAPPHMDYKNDVQYMQSCELAVKSDIIINTVQCGSDGQTTTVWNRIAKLAEGSFAAIDAGGGMQVVATPVDDELAKLQGALAGTVVAYGDARQQKEVSSKLSSAAMADKAINADRMLYMFSASESTPASAAAPSMVVSGRGDLVRDVAEGKVELSGLKPEELPAELQKLDAPARAKYLEEQAGKRKVLQNQVEELTKQRQEFIDAELAKQAAEGKGDGFDSKVREMVRSQAAVKGMKWEE
ncbi:MAG: VWA domain-containing protein [Phycisphaerales bacterium]|nr:VWA domain-containing protein [Phycisphaerales bacterium]